MLVGTVTPINTKNYLPLCAHLKELFASTEKVLQGPRNARIRNSFFIDDNNNLWGCGSNTFQNEPTERFTHFKMLEDVLWIFSQLVSGSRWKCGSCGKEMRKNHGQLGRKVNPETCALKPTRISDLPKIISVAASFDKHSLFLEEGLQ